MRTRITVYVRPTARLERMKKKKAHVKINRTSEWLFRLNYILCYYHYYFYTFTIIYLFSVSVHCMRQWCGRCTAELCMDVSCFKFLLLFEHIQRAEITIFLLLLMLLLRLLLFCIELSPHFGRWTLKRSHTHKKKLPHESRARTNLQIIYTHNQRRTNKETKRNVKKEKKK